MNVIWYVSICMVFLSTSLAFSLMAENKRLKNRRKKSRRSRSPCVGSAQS